MKSAPVGFRKTFYISDREREESKQSVAQSEAQKSEKVTKYEESESEKSEDY